MTAPASEGAASLARLGVYGGAFDPPHIAHHSLARAAIAQLQLDQLRIFPTGQAWHKARQPSAAVHRLAMAQLAFADLPEVQVDPRETYRAGPTYTFDTLSELRQQYPQAELFLLMGSDQFNAFGQWHRWRDIAQIATICVAARAISAGAEGLKTPPPEVQTACKIHTIDMPVMTTSATDLRSRIGRGIALSTLVNDAVARYIAEHRLYAAPPAPNH